MVPFPRQGGSQLLDLKGRIPSVQALQDALLDGYRSMVPWTVDPARLRWWTAVGLVELAGKQLRRLRPNWRTRVAELLAVTDEVLAA